MPVKTQVEQKSEFAIEDQLASGIMREKKSNHCSPRRQMAGPSDNETWLIETGDLVIRKKAKSGDEALLPWEVLVYCLWAADYGMRNAGDLDTAADVHSAFHEQAGRIARQLSLPLTQEAFSLSKDDLGMQFFERFEPMCDEIKAARPPEAVEMRVRRTKRST
ncbi:MAG: hypothetical protein U0744_13310 [Gemmataceae bacterium]